MILALRTDKPEAELYLYDHDKRVDAIIWQAHRELSDTLIIKIEELLQQNNSDLRDITGIIIFQGPGSFTGLRIGITTANTLAYTLQCPIAAAAGENWIENSLIMLEDSSTNNAAKIVVPAYGAEPNITAPRK